MNFSISPFLGRRPSMTRSAHWALLMVALVTVTAAGLAQAQAPAPAVVPAPSIDARSYVLLDFASGAVLAETNADERVEPASITKIMTVYAAAHALEEGLIKLTDEVVVSEKAWKMEGSRMFLEVGKVVTVDQLLDGIIVQSGNDASVALAEHVSGSEEVFAGVMNQHAARLGMDHSAFANATGLPDPGTYVTARDVARLGAALIGEFPDIYARFSEREFTFNGIHQLNRNRLLARDASVDGIKTGHTESAGFCLVSSAKRDHTRLIAAVMGTASDSARTEASYQLLNYGFRFFETRELYAADAVVTQARVWRGESDTLDLGPSAAVSITIPRGSYERISAVAEIDNPVKAPIEVGQEVGRMKLTLDGAPLRTIPLLARTAVPEASLFSRLYDDVMLMFE